MLKSIQIDYEAKEKDKTVSRRAVVVCKSETDGVKFLAKFIGQKNFQRVNALSYEKDIHAISDGAIDYLFTKSEYVKKLLDSNIDKNSETNSILKYTCPWCDKEFDKAVGCKVHIQKVHKKD